MTYVPENGRYPEGRYLKRRMLDVGCECGHRYSVSDDIVLLTCRRCGIVWGLPNMTKLRRVLRPEWTGLWR